MMLMLIMMMIIMLMMMMIRLMMMMMMMKRDAEMWVPFNCAAGAALSPALEWPLIDQHQDGEGDHDDHDHDNDHGNNEDHDKNNKNDDDGSRYQEQLSWAAKTSHRVDIQVATLPHIIWFSKKYPPPYYLILEKSHHHHHRYHDDIFFNFALAFSGRLVAVASYPDELQTWLLIMSGFSDNMWWIISIFVIIVIFTRNIPAND